MNINWDKLELSKIEQGYLFVSKRFDKLEKWSKTKKISNLIKASKNVRRMSKVCETVIYV